ncbi:MAG: response regulator [Trichloromonas sp.]|nr:response regulator [Trichloromonas sp.]
MGKPTILIIDDHRPVGMLLENVLRLHGYGVLYAETGEEGLALARREAPALVLLDIMMPEMDGFRVCEALKADERTREIPVVFVTARGEAPAVERAKAVGGVGFIRKPFKSQQIVEVLDGLLLDRGHPQ